MKAPKLIHLGFTTAGNAELLNEHKRPAAVFPDSNNERWIPVYMLEGHLHRVGYDSALYCENDKMQQEIKELKLELERQKIRGAALDAIRDFCLYSGIPPSGRSVVDSVIEEIKRLRGQVVEKARAGFVEGADSFFVDCPEVQKAADEYAEKVRREGER